MTLPLLWTITLIVAYLLGSIPFGLLLTKMAGLQDIRTIGSGNIGATNVLRTGNKKIALLTLLLDGFKGWLAIAVAMNLAAYAAMHQSIEAIPQLLIYAAGFAALIGHIFPVWLKFKGGKGVATYLGLLLAISWPAAVITGLNWIAVFYSRKISSLASLTAFFFAPFWLFIFTNTLAALFAALCTILIFFTHRQNIRRLLKGEEQSFSRKPA